MKFKEDSFEVIFFARGGEGGKSAAEILAQAAANEGKYVKAFPIFGPERSGAPTKIFLRISKKEIRTQEPIIDPDVVIVLDDTLLSGEHAAVAKNLDRDETLIVNSTVDETVLRKKIPEFKGSIHAIDASGLAQRIVGKPIPNLVALGHLIKISQVVKLESLIEAFRDIFLEKFGPELTEKNIESIRVAYDEI